MISTNSEQIRASIEQHNPISEFRDISITDTLIINSSTRNLNLKFYNCQFLGSVKIVAGTASASVNFHNCEFESFFEFFSVSGSPGSIFARDSFFKKGLSIDFKNNRVSIDIDSTQVFEWLEIKGKEIYELSLVGLNIGANNDLRTKLEGIKVAKANISNSFLGHAEFSDTVFEGNVSFDNSSFTSFTGYECKFNSDVYCNNTNFGGQLFFNGASFLGQALFINCNAANVACIADFSGAVFEKKSFFNKSIFKEIVIKNSDFKDMASFKEMVVEDIEIERSIFHKGADFSLTKFKNADRETYRTIRSELQKVNNKFEVLYYHAKELEIYRSELTWQHNFGEKAMLTLNKYSNNYGLYWWWGVYFTLLMGVIFYILYLCFLPTLPFQWGWVSSKSFLNVSNENVKYFIRFFTITHDFDFMKSCNPTALNYVVDFTGRIFLGFGIYQTIAAFRKYGKI